MKNDHFEDLDEKLKSMPKPPMSPEKKDAVQQSIMEFHSNYHSKKQPFSIKKLFLSGPGGLLAVAALLLFVFIATTMEGENQNTGNQGVEDPWPPEEETIISEFLFEGDSENWSGELYYYGEEYWWREEGKSKYENNHSEDLKIIYKGELEELADMKNMEIFYKLGSGESTKRMSFQEPPREKEFTSSGGGGGTSMTREDDIVEVTIKWDGKEESFELVISDNLEEYANRGPSNHQLVSKIESYIIRNTEEDILANVSYDFDENNEDWFMSVSLTKMLPEAMEEEIRTIVDGRMDVNFQFVNYSEQQLNKKRLEIEAIIDESNEFDANFDVFNISVNPRENKVEIGITPLTDENVEFLHDYFGEDLVHVVEGYEAYDDGGMEESED